MRIFVMTTYEIIGEVECIDCCYYFTQKITTTLFGFVAHSINKEVMYHVTDEYLMEVGTGNRNYITDNVRTAKAQLRYLGLSV